MRVSRRHRGQSRSSGSKMGALLIGAVVGLAVGALLADRDGLRALRETLAGTRRRAGGGRPGRADGQSRRARPLYQSPEAPDEAPQDPDEVLEHRVLEAFRHDPVLAERPVDISAIGTGIIELTGWVRSAEEARHATTLARGTIGVTTVVNRLAARPAAD